MSAMMKTATAFSHSMSHGIWLQHSVTAFSHGIWLQHSSHSIQPWQFRGLSGLYIHEQFIDHFFQTLAH
jgi:hypothetical protein